MRMPISRRAALLGSAAIVAAASTAPSWADPKPAAPELRRRVLALYDGAIETRLNTVGVHRLAALPLEWLGLTLDYHDIRNGLPPVWNDGGYRGVLTWFLEPNLPDYPGYVAWVEHVARTGLKVVQIDDAAPKPGAIPAVEATELRRRMFAALGIKWLEQWSAVTLGDQIVHRDEAHTEFETRFDAGLPAYELYEPIGADAKSWLVVSRADQARSRSALILVTGAGGFIAPGYAVRPDPETGVRQWYVDPFAFFAAAFATADLPAFDTTTLCGRRIYYSHVDGDGWRSVSQIRAPGRAPSTNAEIILQQVVTAHPDLPVTIAPIAAEMDPAFAGDLRAINAARGFFRLPNVEPASHTYTHPFRWEFFKDYNPAAEAPFLDAYQSAVGGHTNVVETAVQSPGPPGCCGQAARSGKSPPRAFGGRPFDLAQEVGGSAKMIDALAVASGKQVRLLQWPGDCTPFPAALRAVADAGLLNINGGDTRCDREYPSVSAVAPLGFRRDGLTQVYASNSSEELYTDLWTDRFFGFRDLPETWDRTAAPRRLKPLALYYHMYSGERRASLDALLRNIAALRLRGDYIGVTASRFADLARSFFTAALSREAEASWRVRERGGLQTIRFAGGEQRMVDAAASPGVLGERVINGALYVALDPTVAAPLVTLVDRAGGLPPRPMLAEASWEISALVAADRRFSFRASGFGPGTIVWRVPEPGRWIARMGDRTSSVSAGSDGVLRLEFPALTAADIAVARDAA